MAYRDENQSLQARVAELEGELAAANARIERLTGNQTKPAKTSYSRFLGVDSEIHHSRDFSGELDDKAFERLAQAWRRVFPAGAKVSQVGRTLTLQSGDATATVRVDDGTTSLRMNASYNALSVILGVTTPGLALFALGGLAEIAQRLALSKANIVWMMPLAILASYFVLRTAFGRLARSHAKRHAAAFEAVVDVSQRELDRLRQVRIDAELEAEGEAQADAEAEVEAEAEAEAAAEAEAEAAVPKPGPRARQPK